MFQPEFPPSWEYGRTRTRQRLKILVQGVLAIDGTPTEDTPWFEASLTVSVDDGFLTISNAPGAVNNKINFFEITLLP
jgi:hypothetical protein